MRETIRIALTTIAATFIVFSVGYLVNPPLIPIDERIAAVSYLPSPTFSSHLTHPRLYMKIDWSIDPWKGLHVPAQLYEDDGDTE